MPARKSESENKSQPLFILYKLEKYTYTARSVPIFVCEGKKRFEKRIKKNQEVEVKMHTGIQVGAVGGDGPQVSASTLWAQLDCGRKSQTMQGQYGKITGPLHLRARMQSKEWWGRMMMMLCSARAKILE